MVMEPNRQAEGTQGNVDYPQDIPMDYQQAQLQADGSSKMQTGKPDGSMDPNKVFQHNSDSAVGVAPDKYKGIHPASRAFGQNYNDGGMQRQQMYPDGSMGPAADQHHYPPGVMQSTNSTPQAANTPTLNQLLTQSPNLPKYPNSSYSEYSSSNTGSPASAQTAYEGWSGQPHNSNSSMYSNPMNQLRAGMPPPSRAMVPSSVQMGMNSMYDRGGQQMHPNYRHPNAQFGPGGSPYRMMGAPPIQGFHPHSSNAAMDSTQAGATEGSEGENSHSVNTHHRVRPMMAPGRMMGPPRTPGLHQMDPAGGQMMPPPNQNPGYPGMYPYGNQTYRNPQMPPFSSYPNSQVGAQMNRGQGQPSFPPGPMNPQSLASQVNGPAHKSLPHSPGQTPLNQPSPGGSMRGMSPAPIQQGGLTPSPAPTASQKALSPCPSPSVSSHRSMPPSPASAAQLNSPLHGMSPRPDSVSSPRTDTSVAQGKQEQQPISLPSAAQPPNISQQTSNSNPPGLPDQAKLPEQQQQAMHGQLVHQLSPGQSLPGQQPPPHGQQPLPHGQQPLPHGQQPPPHGQQPPPHGQQPPPHGQQPPPHGQQPPPHGQQPPPHGQQPPPHGQLPQPQLHGQLPHAPVPGQPSQQQVHGQQPSVHGQQPQPHMMPGHLGQHPQPRMIPPGSMPNSNQHMGGPPQVPGSAMGNGLPQYPPKIPGQPPSHYQQAGRMPGPAYAGGAGGAQYPPNPNQQMPGYQSSGNATPPQAVWQQQQNPPMAPAGGMYPLKNEKNAVASPLSAAQSPVPASPHGSEGNRRPSSRKSDTGSHKSQKPAGANTVHGTNMDVFNKLVELGPEHQLRKPFLEHLCAYYQEMSKPLTTMPCIGKNQLDLYNVYTKVKLKGGFQQVCKKKQWKLVGSEVAASTAANAAYTVKKAYIKFLLNYECRYDLNNADPQAILSSVETKKERQNRNAPSPAGSGNSQDSHLRGYPDYGIGPGVHHPGHPAHMGGGQMRPGQYHDPNMPPHQQHGYMNYNNMGGPTPQGMPNGHHPMPPQQPGSMGATADDQQQQQQQMSAPGDPNLDSYRQQQMAGQYNSQQQIGAPGYHPRHPYYGPRMPLPGGQRPPFHQQTSGPGPQQPQPGGPPGAQMRMPQPQATYPPMYRDNSYPSSQPGPMGPTSMPHAAGYPAMDNRTASVSSMYSQSSAAGANTTQISTTSNMGQPPQHPTPATPIPRYPPRPGYQTPTRGALSAMLSNSAATPDARHPAGHQWRQRPQAPFPGYTPGPNDPMPRRQLPMVRQPAPQPKKEIIFPPGSVEAARPSKLKRRVLHSRDIGKVDPWRLSMCLRSGLLCETTWALDAITILLRDDVTWQNFSFDRLRGMLDILIAHYQQSLASMFEELSDLSLPKSEPSSEIPRLHLSDDNEDDDEILDSKKIMLQQNNYSWSARNGMQVIIDTDLKKGHLIPTPSMYSRRIYTHHTEDPIVVPTYESGGSNELYTKHCTKSIKLDREFKTEISLPCLTLSDDVKKDNTVVHSTSVSSTSTSQSLRTDKSLSADIPLCNGCISHDVKLEPNEYNSDPKLSMAPQNQLKADGVKQEMSFDDKVAKSTLDLEVLEAKLRLSRKRRFSETIDVEPIIRDEAALEFDVCPKQEEVAVRCVTLANILRGFSFGFLEKDGSKPDPRGLRLIEYMAKNVELLNLYGRLLSVRTQVDPKKSKRDWWWPILETLREHTLVSLSNVAGHVELIEVSHEICFPLLNSLLFWSTTSAAYARDPLPNSQSLSIRYLVMEILCKLCAHSDNMNLLLATPPHDRIAKLFQCLAKLLSEPDQARREFALVIVSCLCQADPVAACGLATQPSCVSQLISILETAESAAYSVAQRMGVSALRENPESMGTSLDMIRRTSATLVEMAQIETNHKILLKQQDRLLNLVMSQILDQHVAKMLSDVLYECTKDCQRRIEPSYVISTRSEVHTTGPTGESADDCSSVDHDSTGQDMEDNSKRIAEVKDECELDKENINKSSKLKTNNMVGMLSAAS